MAKARLGPLVQSISGSIGGVTFSNTSSGQLIRPRPQKVSKQSFVLVRGRARLQTASNTWARMSTNLQQQWATVAAELNSRAPIGVRKWRGGRDLFMSEAMVWTRIGGTLATAAPTRRQRPQLAGLSVSWTVAGLLITYTRPTGMASGLVLIYGARSCSRAGFPAKNFKVLLATSYGSAGTINPTTQFTANLGAADIGEYFAIRVRARETDGLWSNAWEWTGTRAS